jgi:hypothetical protein
MSNYKKIDREVLKYDGVDQYDSEEELEEEDFIIQAAATAAIGAALAALDYSQAYYDKKPYHDSALSSALLPSPVPTSTMPSSTSAPISAASSSERKYSALDDDALSVSHNSSGGKCSSAAAMQNVLTGLASISSSIDGMTAERRLCRLQQEAGPRAPTSSPERRHDAIRRLQQTETYLDAEPMVALVDLFEQNTAAAEAYMLLEREDYRKTWVAKRLREAGHVVRIAGIAVVSDGSE